MLKVNPTGKSKKEVHGNKNRHSFLFQKRQDSQPVLLGAAENIGEKVDHLCRIIKENILIWIVF